MPALRRLSAVLLVLAVAVSVAGCSRDAGADPDTGTLRVVDATVTEPPTSSVAAVRFVIENGTGSDDTLTGVSSPIGTVSIHESVTDDKGLSTMRPVADLAVPADGKVTFAPGGLHVMVEDPTQPLVAGVTFPLTLTFAKAGAVTTTVKVVAAGTADTTEHDHDG
jgi:hypothetical protein